MNWMSKVTTDRSKTTTAATAERKFRERLHAAVNDIVMLYNRLYKGHPDHETCYPQLLQIIEAAFANRTDVLKKQDINEIWTDKNYHINIQGWIFIVYEIKLVGLLKGQHEKYWSLEWFASNRFKHLWLSVNRPKI